MKRPVGKNPCPHQAGLTLLEYLLGVTILTMFVGTLVVSSRSLLGVESAGGVRVRAQEEAQRALASILPDLRATGFRGDYPYFFVDGAAAGAFAVHAHEPAEKAAQEGDRDFGPDREIVLQRPLDADRDGVPDFSADGALLWSADEISYVLTTGADGTNVLSRRLNGGSARVVARHVERVSFEDITVDPTIPFGSIRVRLWLRLRDDQGLTHTHEVEATVRPRNTIPIEDQVFSPATDGPGTEQRRGERPLIG